MNRCAKLTKSVHKIMCSFFVPKFSPYMFTCENRPWECVENNRGPVIARELSNMGWIVSNDGIRLLSEKYTPHVCSQVFANASWLNYIAMGYGVGYILMISNLFYFIGLCMVFITGAANYADYHTSLIYSICCALIGILLHNIYCCGGFKLWWFRSNIFKLRNIIENLCERVIRKDVDNLEIKLLLGENLDSSISRYMHEELIRRGYEIDSNGVLVLSRYFSELREHATRYGIKLWYNKKFMARDL